MSKLTYRDIPLIQTAGAKISSSNTGWWLEDKHGLSWYVTESDDNQYLKFFCPETDEDYPKMDRELFAGLFE